MGAQGLGINSKDNSNNNTGNDRRPTNNTIGNTQFTSLSPEYHEPKEEEVVPLDQDILMECIENNKSIPNQIQVSDNVLETHLVTKSNLQPRPKPWEVPKK